MRKIDYLLVAALVLSPMTGLRFGKVGPAEVLALAWCILACLNARYPLVPGALGKAWIVFFGILVAGTLHGVTVTPEATNPAGLVTWAYLGVISVLGYAVLQGRTHGELEHLMSMIGGGSTLWFSALYAYSVNVASTFLGAPLWYGSRFAGGGENPHQVAVLITACIFINFRSFHLSRTVPRRLWWLTLTIAAVVLGYQTASATLLLAVGVAAAVTLFFVALDRIPSRSGRAGFTVVVTMALIAVGALLWRRIVELIARFVASDSNGEGRITLWLDFTDVVEHVLFLGLGPGPYADGGQMEFHNSYLELAAILGIPATTALLVMMCLALRRLMRHGTLMTIMLALLVYALPGFAIRRLSFWLIFAICLATAMVIDRARGDCPEKSQSPERGVVPRR